MSERRVFYLVNLTGLPNYGDELIGAVWLRHLAKHHPDAEVWVDSPTPGRTQLLIGHLHPGARFVDTVWRLHEMAPDDPWEAARWAERVVHDPGQAPQHVAGVELLRRADVLHLSGGGFLNDVWPKHLAVPAAMLAAAGLSGARTAITGHGLLPAVTGAHTLTRALLGRFDIVDVRDEPSGRFLEAPDAVTCDDVFLDVPYTQTNLSDEHPRFMLCLQSDLLEQGPSALAERVLRILRSWDAVDEPIGVVEGIPRIDREVYELMSSSIPNAHFYPYWETWRTGMPLGANQKWISSRFHLHLVAAAAGASGVALSVRPDYYDIKHQALIDLGSHWTLDSGAKNPSLPEGGGFTAEHLSELHAKKSAVAERIYRAPEPKPAPAEELEQEVELESAAIEEERARKWRVWVGR